jgi:hypothetical protein
MREMEDGGAGEPSGEVGDTILKSIKEEAEKKGVSKY